MLRSDLPPANVRRGRTGTRRLCLYEHGAGLSVSSAFVQSRVDFSGKMYIIEAMESGDNSLTRVRFPQEVCRCRKLTLP